MLGEDESSEASKHASRTAPCYNIPSLSITCVEHPFIVKDVSRGLKTLGGPPMVEHLVGRDSMTAEASLFLRPDDRMCKPISSNNRTTNNILLRITLPRRTGRKRKRGSQTPFQYYRDRPKPQMVQSGAPPESSRSISSRDVHYLMQGLQDNTHNNEIVPLGTIEQTHRFRSMPDFVWSTTKSPFMNKINETILPMNYSKMKSFKLDLSKGQNVSADLLPPPTLTHLPIPFNYAYKQNLGIKQVLDNNGRVMTVNTQAARKISTRLLAADDENIPNAPSSDTPPFDSLESDMKRIVQQVQGLLDERPIWTRRALSNQLDASDWKKVGRYVFQYTGYMFRSGPWRDALVKFGLDPRTDPKYRIYQTMMFQTEAVENYVKSKRPGALYGHKRWGGARKKNSRQQELTSHIFDGVNLPLEGKVFQVCDIADNMIKSILSTAHIRDVCDLRNDGWYLNGTWAKAKVIMKEKVNYIASGKGTPQDSLYAPLLTIPDVLDQSTRHQAVFKKGEARAEIVELASQIRGCASRSMYQSENRSMYDIETGQESGEGGRDQGTKKAILQTGSFDEGVQDIALMESSSGEMNESSSNNSHGDTDESDDELDESDDHPIDDDARNDGIEDNDEGDIQRAALLFDRKLKDGQKSSFQI